MQSHAWQVHWRNIERLFQKQNNLHVSWSRLTLVSSNRESFSVKEDLTESHVIFMPTREDDASVIECLASNLRLPSNTSISDQWILDVNCESAFYFCFSLPLNPILRLLLLFPLLIHCKNRLSLNESEISTMTLNLFQVFRHLTLFLFLASE
jgi:hypothetical protein